MNKFTKILIALLLLSFLFVSTLNVSALMIESVNYDSAEIKPGDTITVDITLENNADEEIKDVNVFLDVTNLPFAPESTAEVSIEEIRAEKNKIARLKLIVLENAKSDVYKIPIKITYTDESNQTQTKTSLISIRVTSQPVIDVIADENLLLKNQNNEVNIQIINKGLADVKFLEVIAHPSGNIELLSPAETYVGDLESDDFDTVTYSVFFNDEKNVNFPITVRYQDTLNNEYEQTFSVYLKVYSREEAIERGLVEKSYTLEITLLIILIILAIILYRSWRKTKRKQQS